MSISGFTVYLAMEHNVEFPPNQTECNHNSVHLVLITTMTIGLSWPIRNINELVVNCIQLTIIFCVIKTMLGGKIHSVKFIMVELFLIWSVICWP